MSNDTGVVFGSIQMDTTQSVDYQKSKLICNLHIAFTYPVECRETSSLSDLQKIFVEKIFPLQYANFSPKDVVSKFSKQYISDFQAIQFKNFFDDDAMLEDENSFMYELDLEDTILYNRNNFISFLVKNTNYEGGLHSSNNVSGYVIDLNTEKILTGDDFEGNNYKKNLSSILVKKIATANGLDDISQLENMGYTIEDIVPNENFTIDDKGITYYFNDDIAANFIGTTEVFISYEELKPYLSNDNSISSLVGK